MSIYNGYLSEQKYKRYYPCNYRGVKAHVPSMHYADDGYGNLYRVSIDKVIWLFTNWYEKYQHDQSDVKQLPLI